MKKKGEVLEAEKEEWKHWVETLQMKTEEKEKHEEEMLDKIYFLETTIENLTVKLNTMSNKQDNTEINQDMSYISNTKEIKKSNQEETRLLVCSYQPFWDKPHAIIT